MSTNMMGHFQTSQAGRKFIRRLLQYFTLFARDGWTGLKALGQASATDVIESEVYYTSITKQPRMHKCMRSAMP